MENQFTEMLKGTTNVKSVKTISFTTIEIEADIDVQVAMTIISLQKGQLNNG